MSTLSGIIWILNGILQWSLLVLVLWRKGWQRHFAFATYIFFCAFKTTFLFVLDSSPYFSYYFRINWGFRLVGLPLMVAVLIEVFASVFRPYSTLPKGTLRWFQFAIIGLIVATAVAAVVFPGSGPGKLVHGILLINRSLSIIFCGIFSLTALMSGYFGIPWQTRTYGIGVGFLLYMSVDLFTSALLSFYGLDVSSVVQVFIMLAFTLALTTWIIYFCIPDTPPRKPTLEQARRLQKALDATHRKMESLR